MRLPCLPDFTPLTIHLRLPYDRTVVLFEAVLKLSAIFKLKLTYSERYPVFKGLLFFMQRIGTGEIGRLVSTQPGRLVRFGSELLLARCGALGAEVVIIKQNSQPASFEEELAKAVLEILAVFCARLFGSCKYQIQLWVEELWQAAESL
jgi:hypothetical protein